MKWILNNKEYDIQQLTKIIGKKPRNKFKIEELFKMDNKQLCKILREELKIEYCKSWRKKEYKILAVLFGREGKCNAIQIDKDTGEFRGLCKQVPSEDDKENQNGRCFHHFGKTSSDKRKTNGRKAGDPGLEGNTLALTTGTGIRSDKQLNDSLKRLEKLKNDSKFKTDILFDKKNEIDNVIDGLKRRLTLQEDSIARIEEVGIAGKDPVTRVPKINRFNEIDIDEKTGKVIYTYVPQFTQMEYDNAVKVADSLYDKLMKAIDLKQTKLKQEDETEEDIQKLFADVFNEIKEKIPEGVFKVNYVEPEGEGND